MIKINLLGDDTVQDNSGTFIVAAYCASLVLCIGIFFWLQSSLDSKVLSVKNESLKLEAQLAHLQETTKEVKDLDKKRAELNDKLVVIATLKRNKVGPVRVLDDLNMALPERAWVTEVREGGGALHISGIALDNQTIATFMKDLGTSEYFKDVELVETKMVDKKGVKVREFTLDAKISYAGKIKLKQAAEASAGKEQKPVSTDATTEEAKTS
ncbi:MAG: PilN domain-containing protein [Deltaproteobacteria bacterium]|nr:PilN domain-containing protein [Deltaproteobacteria bacterium]